MYAHATSTNLFTLHLTMQAELTESSKGVILRSDGGA